MIRSAPLFALLPHAPEVSPLPIILAAITIQLVLRYFFLSRHKPPKGLCHPPGPRGIPVLGNTLQIPNDKQWLRFHEWTRKYGDVVHITTLGQPVVILGSTQAAYDLFESRGTIYSDRPRAVMAGELVGWDRGLGYAPYGARFRTFRRMMHGALGPRVVPALEPIQNRESARLLLRMLDEPGRFVEHARESTGATIVMIAYGYRAQPHDDPLVHIAEVAMQGFARASEPGAFLVDVFPQLKHIPSWMPGAGFKGLARAWHEDLERLYDVPFAFVRGEMEAGRAVSSFTSRCLNEIAEPTGEEVELIKAAAASLYSGGADTTPSSIVSFILAMTLYPDIQRRAQAEVDAVLSSAVNPDAPGKCGGPTRLPRFRDSAALPYVRALVKEVLRWNPAVPLGLPHLTLEDDVYHGYFIPKGAVVWANIWSLLHDERYFPDPHRFDPERYLSPEGSLIDLDRMRDPGQIAFGFGRRICPGMHLAEKSIFITITSILSVFNISKDVDESGMEVDPVEDYAGFISHPKPFRCQILPRSEQAANLIRAAAEAADVEDNAGKAYIAQKT